MKESITFINSELISDVVAELCRLANIHISKDVYNVLFDSYLNEQNKKSKYVLSQILENIKLAKNKQRPICQDTGIVIVFVQIGQNVHIQGELLEKAINLGVEESYKDNYFRKSIVKDPVFNRENTKTNTPAVIYTELVPGNSIKISVEIKGCGSENMSSVKMLRPSDGVNGIIDFVVETVKKAGANPCPPIRLGIGIGGTMEYAGVLSKKALLMPVKTEDELADLADLDELARLELEIIQRINSLNIGAAGLGGKSTAYGVNILTHPSHIAGLPVAVSINCHASRHASAEIFQDEIRYDKDDFLYEFKDIETSEINTKVINTDDLENIRMLKAGEIVLLSGEVYTARDAAHKRLADFINKGKDLPIDIKDKIIYYTGPCPASDNEIIGPAGPTTSYRMDSYAPIMHQKRLLGSIGKGQRSDEVIQSIKENKGIYFIAAGGAACSLAEKVEEAEIIAFPDLGAEAIYRLKIKNFPVIVAIDTQGNSLY